MSVIAEAFVQVSIQGLSKLHQDLADVNNRLKSIGSFGARSNKGWGRAPALIQDFNRVRASANTLELVIQNVAAAFKALHTDASKAATAFRNISGSMKRIKDSVSSLNVDLIPLKTAFDNAAISLGRFGAGAATASPSTRSIANSLKKAGPAMVAFTNSLHGIKISSLFRLGAAVPLMTGLMAAVRGSATAMRNFNTAIGRLPNRIRSLATSIAIAGPNMISFGSAAASAVVPMRQLGIHAKPVADAFAVLKNAIRSAPASMRMLGRSAQAAIPALQNIVPALTSAIAPLGDFARAADIAAVSAAKLKSSLGGIRTPSLTALNSSLSRTASSAKQTQGVFSKLFQAITLGFFNSERSANRFGSTVQQMSRRAIAGLFGIRSAVGAIGIAFATGVAIRWMANVTSDAEQAQVAFEGMLGSAGKARTMLRQIQDLADKTPLELPEVRESTRNLVAFGYPAKTAVDTLRMIGDVSQGAMVPLQDLVQMYGKAFETNRVNGEAFRQFGRRGVRVVSELADMLGKTTQEIREMGSRGELTFKDLDAAFKRLTANGAPFHNMLARMGGTVHGRFTTMIDSVRALAKELGLALAPAAKAGINVLIIAFDKAKESFRPFVPQIKRFSAAASSAFASVGQSVASSIPVFFQYISTLYSFWKAVFQMVGMAIGIITGPFKSAVGGISIDILGILDTVKFMSENWRLFFDLIVANTGLAMFNAWDRVKTFFLNIKNMLVWIKDHFYEAFLTAADIILGIMENLGKNIREIMAAAWDFAMGRGFQPALVKLTAGTEQAMARLMGQLPKAVQANILTTTPEIEALLKKINDAREAYDEQKRKDAEEASKQEQEEALDEGRMPKEGGGKTEKFAFKELTQFARDIQKGIGPEEKTAANTAATAKNTQQILNTLKQRGFGAGNALPPGLLTGAFHP